jgi:GT2 family glycosyltransferase
MVPDVPRITVNPAESIASMEVAPAWAPTGANATDSFSGNKTAPDEIRPSSAVASPRVSVIIVTYGSSAEIPDCVESLLNQSVPVEIFLVDNASLDNTAQVISDYAARYENVHAILNTENVGLAAGNNVPMGKCRGEYLLMLNPDTAFRGDSLERMVEFLDRNLDVGVVGPKNVYPDGSPHVSFRRSWGIRHVVTWRVLPYRLPRLLHDRFSSYDTQDVLYVSGACLLIRRAIFEQIGGYDPEYFLTIEDVCDLCIRVKQTGSRVVFLGEEEVVHLAGRSGVQAPYIVVWHGNRGTVYHFLKHKGIAQALVVSFLLLSASATRVVLAAMLGLVKKRYRNVARIYGRVFWGLIVRNPIWEGKSKLSTSPKNVT